MSTVSRNIAYNLAGQSLLLILGFVATKFIFGRLGEDALGIIYFSVTVSSVLFALLEAGISSTTAREVAAHFHDDQGYVRDLIRTTSTVNWATYLLLALVLYFGAPFLVERWITLRTMDKLTAIRLVQILGIGGLAALPRSLYGGLLRGLQRMEFNNAIDVSITTLQQCGTILLLVVGQSIFHIAYWMVACNMMGVLAYIFVSGRLFSGFALIPGYSPGVVRRNIDYSAKVMNISILALVHTQTDKVILSKFLSVGTLGYYSFVYGLTARASSLSDAIAQAVFPSFAALFKAGEHARVMMQYRKLQDLVCLASVPVFSAIVFYAEPLLAFVFGEGIARTLVIPVFFLSVGFYMHGTLVVPYFASLAAGRPDITVRVNFLALFIIVPATIGLIYYFGLAGAGFSWILYHLFVYAFGVPRICVECLRIPVKEWYEHVARIAIAASVTYGLAWEVFHSFGTARISSATVAFLGGTVAFMLAAYWLMSDDLRAAMTRLLCAVRVRVDEPA